jgi:hypothetical protein
VAISVTRPKAKTKADQPLWTSHLSSGAIRTGTSSTDTLSPMMRCKGSLLSRPSWLLSPDCLCCSTSVQDADFALGAFDREGRLILRPTFRPVAACRRILDLVALSIASLLLTNSRLIILAMARAAVILLMQACPLSTFQLHHSGRR